MNEPITINGGTIDAHGLYHGRPTQRKINIIRYVTMTDSAGLRYWRKASHEGWRRLRTDADLQDLNDAILRWVAQHIMTGGTV